MQSIWCIQDYFRKRNCRHAEKIFLVLEFLSAKYMVEISSQKYLFLLQVDHCPQFLFAQVVAEITFLFHTLFYFSPSYSDQEVEGETKQKLLICIFYDQLFLQRKHRYNGYRFTWVYRKDKTLLQFCLTRFFLYHRSFLDPWMVDLLLLSAIIL